MIQFESVNLSFQEKNLFSRLDLNIRKCEKVLIQGKSGIGKTSLFRLLLGFLPVNSGKITFHGCKIDQAHIKEIRNQIFYLSQDIDLRQEPVENLIHDILTANSIIYSDSKAKEFMNLLELDSKLLTQNSKNLSGGERQRAGLLLCFLLNRSVWLLDEPTSALDDAMKNKIADFICNQNQDKTIIIISHDTVWKHHKDIRIERLG